MIRPEQLTADASDASVGRLRAVALEKQCDIAINIADATGVWPARVGVIRMIIGQEAIDEIIAKYAAVGWKVERSKTRDCYLTIDRPVPGSLTAR